MTRRDEPRRVYPSRDEWRAMRALVLTRAHNACEQCGAPDEQFVARGTGPDAGTYMLEDGSVFDDSTGEGRGLARGSEYEAGHFVRIALAVAHVDANDGTSAGLRALCQQCRARLNLPQRARKAAETRARTRDDATGQEVLFGERR